MVNRIPPISNRAPNLRPDDGKKLKRTNSLLDKTVGTSLRLPEIMEILERREAEKNRGILGIDKRTLSHLGSALAQSPGGFNEAIAGISKGLSNIDITKKQDVRDALQTAIGFGQSDLNQEEAETRRTHELSRDDKKFERELTLQNHREQLAEKRLNASFSNAKALAKYKNDLLNNPEMYSNQQLDPKYGDVSELRPLPSLKRQEYTSLAKRNEEVFKAGGNALEEERYLNEADHIIDHIKGLGGLLQSNLPDRATAVLGKEQKTYTDRLDKIGSLIYQGRVRAAGANATDAFKSEVKKALPSRDRTLEANKAVIDSKKRENRVAAAKSEYYTKMMQAGRVPTDHDFYNSPLGREALAQADLYGAAAEEEESIEDLEAELALLEAEEGA